VCGHPGAAPPDADTARFARSREMTAQPRTSTAFGK
jgi:hypothetical protein